MRRWLWVEVAAAAAAGLGVAGGAAWAQTPGKDAGALFATLQPGVARGDFEVFVEATALRPAAAGATLVRVLVQVPVLAILEQTHKDAANLRIEVQVFPAAAALPSLEAAASAPAAATARERLERTDAERDAALQDFEGVDPVARAEARGTVTAGDRDSLLETDYQLFHIVDEIPPGDYVCSVRVENLSQTKRGLLDRLRKLPLEAEALMLVRVPDLARVPALSDLAFRAGHGTHTDYAARLYGLLNDSLHVQTTVFGSGRHRLQAAILDRDGDSHWRDSLAIDVERRRDVGWHTSVNTLPAGQYVLHVAASGPDGTAATSRSFDVSWDLVTWKESRRELDLEAALALTEDEFESYRGLPVGEKERFLEAFWRRHDPTPETAHNEVLIEFQRRVAHADLNYSETRRGALTDRGRVFVRFGAPAEVQAEAVPSHRLAGQGADLALEKVEDLYVPSEHVDLPPPPSGTGGAPWERRVEQATRQQERTRLMGPGTEVVSYELWIYVGGGEPLLPEDRSVTVDAGLRVLFVDLEGYGRFRFLKSSARLDLPGLGTSY